MKRNTWPLLLAVLALAGQACNLQRILDPSLPTSTSQPSPTPTSSPTPIATPLPTLTNEARVKAGDEAFFYGDWDSALREYQRVQTESQDQELRAAATLGVGRTYAAMGNFSQARQALEDLLETFPNSEARAGAYYTLAAVYAEFDDPQAAAEAYKHYLELRPGPIESYVQEFLGDELVAASDYDGAIAAYEAGLAGSRQGDSSILNVKIGKAQSAGGDYEAAIATYQAILDSTTNDYLKADMDLLIGRAYSALGQPEQAYAYYQDAVTNYPLAYSSYAALVELVNAGVPVDELQRGLIDYNIATITTDEENQQELYVVAIAAFDRYLADNPDEHSDIAHHYRALALRANGDYSGAIQEWDHIIAEHAFDENWVTAYSEKAATQWVYLEDYEGAIDTLLGFVAATPSQPASAEFLFDAARIAERGGRLTRSTEIWPRVADEYPSSEFAYDAVFLAGISMYRLEDYAGAQSLFLRAYQTALSLEQQAQSSFWIAKALQAQGGEEGARNAWQQAAVVDPTGYYSERAGDILEGRPPFEPPASYSFDFDVEAERQEAEAWMRDTFDLPADTDLSGPGALLSDPRFQRGTELWHLGEYELARAEFEDLRLGLVADPANSYRLANYLIDLGIYRTGIFAAREVLTMAGMSDAGTMNAPRYFNRIRFGAYYRDLVEKETAAEGLDPLFFYSMMRQESLFEGFVTSSAGARGLLQITPTTGQEAADLAGWPPDFTSDDLYRPVVSIRLGADYLAGRLNDFDGDLYVALAAYNAGPGPASYWAGLAKGDPDLYLEVVSYTETRNHIRSIYELFTIYSNLYSTAK
ncbi:MAG: tetratricopeptide repeat protein [Chloroflexi bacterium]|nr:tetratricopeptide repeat protein [Chloroflexota bacterium]